MEIKECLFGFKKRIDKETALYFDEVIRKARKEDSFSAELLKQVKIFFLAGGKRLRGAPLYYAYRLAGGKNEQEILKACVAIELVHSFFLVHDDIMDRDDVRHGVETLHRKFSGMGKRFFPNKDHEHFGISMAITAGDLVGSMGSQSPFSAQFPPDRIVRALYRLQGSISRTGLGQAMDIHMEYRGRASEEEILLMYTNKTARYTFECPLHIGATLAGAEEGLLDRFTQYAIPLGIAFQIQDDILGVIGESRKTGKSIGSDIAEGKMTLLMANALKWATESQRQFLRSCLEKGAEITAQDIAEVQKIFETSGSLAYARDLAAKKLEEGIRVVESFPSVYEREARDFFMGVTQYLKEREI